MTRKIIFGIIIVFTSFFLLLVLFNVYYHSRYEIFVGTGKHNDIYRHDRWTGEMLNLRTTIVKPSEFQKILEPHPMPGGILEEIRNIQQRDNTEKSR